MTDQKSPRRSVPRIESIRIKNYRALHNLQLKPLTVLLGASGSGKSTGVSPPEPPYPTASTFQGLRILEATA
jgi:hypothetical protein